MKNAIIIASALAAGTAVMTYFLKKKRTTKLSPVSEHLKRSHHRTNVFARAKG